MSLCRRRGVLLSSPKTATVLPAQAQDGSSLNICCRMRPICLSENQGSEKLSVYWRPHSMMAQGGAGTPPSPSPQGSPHQPLSPTAPAPMSCLHPFQMHSGHVSCAFTCEAPAGLGAAQGDSSSPGPALGPLRALRGLLAVARRRPVCWGFRMAPSPGLLHTSPPHTARWAAPHQAWAPAARGCSCHGEARSMVLS